MPASTECEIPPLIKTIRFTTTYEPMIPQARLARIPVRKACCMKVWFQRTSKNSNKDGLLI